MNHIFVYLVIDQVFIKYKELNEGDWLTANSWITFNITKHDTYD